MNRNRTFISEDFANQLIASLPYTPVKGIFDKNSLDFDGHGEDNSEGRIYGIVPENPNFAWEDFTDLDGETRSYACCDVYLFTGLYAEARLIPGKSQSMEIFRQTLQGEWRKDSSGLPYYHFLSGSLVGLQALGDDVEPCFEGAAFYSLIKDMAGITDIVNYIRKVSIKESDKKMDKTLFRLSDSEKADKIFDLINPNFAEGELNGIITDVYDDYAIYVGRDGFHRAYYTKDGDNIVLGETVPVKIIDVTESEYSMLETMKTVAGSYTEACSNYTEMSKNNEELTSKIEEFEKAIESYKQNEEEMKNKISTYEKQVEDLTSEKNTLEAEKVELNNTISNIKDENKNLSAFKAEIELKQKQDILAKYEEYIAVETIDKLKAEINNFTVDNFKKEVCTAALENDSSIFSHKQEESKMIPKVDNISEKSSLSGAIALLNKRKNGGNK